MLCAEMAFFGLFNTALSTYWKQTLMKALLVDLHLSLEKCKQVTSKWAMVNSETDIHEVT
jgi:hypothetical protein